MATLPKTILPRKHNSLEIEKENFERNQQNSIGKAVNQNEIPMKEKHARSAIIGTFTEKGAPTFWATVNKLPLKGNPIICWKFCHLLHKVLREGHHNAIRDSLRYKPMFADLGKMWGLLREGYGRLIACYCKLLATKLEFHHRNPKFPGNLVVTDEELDDIGERDVNIFFQLTCEMFDYMDDILSLQTSVFGSLDMSRANSMTMSGQCRLAPLIPCIQDSSHLYDYIVKVLFKLHAALPPDTLNGHRERFLKQYEVLKHFYINSSNLQYFKNLIQIPLLPEKPPNFLVASDLSSHVSPVVVLPLHSDSPENESLVEVSALIDTTDSSASNGALHNKFNFDAQSEVSTDTILDEKDCLIQQLLKDIADLKMEIQRISIEDQRVIDGLHRDIEDMERQIAEIERDKEAIKNEKELLSQQNDDAEKRFKSHEEKFSKLKEAYNKLREEHIVLIRSKADIEKQLVNNKLYSEEVNTLKEQLEVERKNKAQLENQLRNEMDRLQTTAVDHQNLHSFINQDLLGQVLKEASNIIEGSMSHIENPSFTYHSPPSDFFYGQVECFTSCLNSLKIAIQSYLDENGVGDLIGKIPYFAHLASNFIEQGSALLATSSNVDHIEKALQVYRNLGALALECLEKIGKRDKEVFTVLEKLNLEIDEIRNMSPSSLTPSSSNQEDLGDLLQAELSDMIKAIEEAASKIEEISTKSREDDTGTKLEVNVQILDACTKLMQTIKILVKAARDLQEEIVAQGKGSASVADFYNKNPRWAEGLISAAKVIGLGAKLLVDAADKVVSGTAKLEVLVVASQEIAAGTAQLVVASRVKADKDSQCLSKLSAASRQVTEATAGVVATAKACAQLVDDSEVMDFSSLTLHQAKKLEMESQVRVLELETNLEKERMKLAELRRRHYHLAGANEGWDQPRAQ